MYENVIITRTEATEETLMEINNVIRKIAQRLPVEEAKTLFYTEEEVKKMEKANKNRNSRIWIDNTLNKCTKKEI